MTGFLLYLLYAFGQAVLLQRLGLRDRHDPVLLVILLALFAPLATMAIAIGMVYAVLQWLATPR